MWAALQLPPLSPCPPTTTTTKTPPRHRSMVVHNRQSREEIGGLGLKSNQPQLHPNAAVKSKSPLTASASADKKEYSEEQHQQQKQLSGSDILMALQRATAHKTKKIKQTRNSRNKAARENQGTNSYFSNTRPLCIKPEWPHRLQELETRLDQLAHGHASPS